MSYVGSSSRLLEVFIRLRLEIVPFVLFCVSFDRAVGRENIFLLMMIGGC